MKTIEHPNIINLIEVIDDPDSDNFYMVLEYVEGKLICAPSGTFGGIGETTSRRCLRDIIAGLMYLHAHGIVHGDIKPDNLLFTREGAIKIGDFSVSHAFEDGNDELCRSPGTPVFTAPECCLVHNPLNLPKELDSELKDLQGLLCKEPAKKMTLRAAADHPWVIRDCGPIPWTSCRCKSGSFQKENEMGSKSDTTDT